MADLTRRAALQTIGAGLGALALGCSGETPAGDADGPGGDAGGDPGGPDGGAPDLSPPPEPVLTPKELLAGIDTIIVVMMENRSFDHYFGRLRGDRTYAAADRVDGLRGGESNPDLNGKLVASFPLTTFTAQDPPHGWNACHAQWNGGKNDGFVRAHAGPNQAEVMGYYDRSQIPFFYALCDHFTLCERWFASVMGPTWPNRFYLHATTSLGKKDNTPFVVGGPATVWERLKAQGLAGKNYGNGVAFYTGGFLGKALAGNSPVARFDDFLKDAKAGTLPPFAMIDPDYLSADDHPAHDIRLGQAFLSTIFQALAQSPQWSRSLLVITYDEHGGFFDHVAPPRTEDPDPDFRQLGFRVPAIVAGPTVRQGFLNSVQLEHCSVAATLRTRNGIASLGPRMDAAADLSSCIDPWRVGKPAPPPMDLPKVTVNIGMLLQSGMGVSSQPELERLAAARALPLHDTRPVRERTLAWLQAGEALGALRLR
jgi:phospholipase C